MKYNVGDKVRIKSIDWYNESKGSVDSYDVVFANGWVFSKPMSNFCGKELIIEKISHATNPPHYIMKDNIFGWTDEMIECKVEEEVGLVDNLSSRWVNEFNLPDGYIFKDENGNIINAQKIVLEKKKKEYPKTYEECCKVLGVDPDNYLTIRNVHCYDGEEEMVKYENDLLNKFGFLWKLIICRNAYWKIAGEEMGLGKPWEPDGNPVYAITRNDGYIIHIETGGNDEVLEFPTAEMRNAFYEAFKKEIEICKELL